MRVLAALVLASLVSADDQTMLLQAYEVEGEDASDADTEMATAKAQVLSKIRQMQMTEAKTLYAAAMKSVMERRKKQAKVAKVAKVDQRPVEEDEDGEVSTRNIAAPAPAPVLEGEALENLLGNLELKGDDEVTPEDLEQLAHQAPPAEAADAREFRQRVEAARPVVGESTDYWHDSEANPDPEDTVDVDHEGELEEPRPTVAKALMNANKNARKKFEKRFPKVAKANKKLIKNAMNGARFVQKMAGMR